MRRFLALIAALAMPIGAAAQDVRAAIIDTAWDTRPYIAELKAAGVQVVGRYLARCPQPERRIPEKRLIDQGTAADRTSEVSQLLANGFAILSIYQYNNDSKNKFSGRDRDGNVLPGADCRPTLTPRSSAEEGRLDAEAAVDQARALGQTRGSAIYFGVDIAYSARDAETGRAIVAYMRAVRQVLSRAGFRLGAYGNGDALILLERENLIDYAWISASRAFPGSTEFHNSGRWHLFQSGVNLEWFTGEPGNCRRGLGLDTNTKNERFADEALGFWASSGLVMLAPSRTRAIFRTRRFACDGDARIRRTATSGARDTIDATRTCRGGRERSHPATIDYANAGRIGRRQGSVVEIDYDDDGTFDGWTALSNLTPSFAQKPAWVFSRAQRRGTRCP